MNAIIFLLKRSIINWIKKLKEKPAVIIVTAIFLFFILVPMLIPSESDQAAKAGDINILYIIFFVLSIFFVSMSLYGGLSTGASFFTMSDVNFMFTSSVSSNKILGYGVLKQMGKSIFVSIFMLFQLSNLRHNFDLSYLKSLYVVFVYMVLVFVSQIITLGIYSYTNGNNLRKRVVKYIGVLLILSVVTYIAFGIYFRGLDVIQDTAVLMFPIAGWLLGVLIGYLNSNIILLVVSIVLTFLFVLLTLVAMIKWKPDYYEDCLINSENAFHAKQYLKGDRNAQANIRKKTKVRNVSSMSFKGGYAATAFFYRQLIEIKRTNKAILFGLSSILFLAIGVGCGILANIASDYVLYIAFGVFCYINIFLVGMTKLSQELSRQFIYLVPDNPFRKLVYASASTLLRPLTDGILLFLPAVFIAQFSIFSSIALVIAYASVNSIFIATNTIIYYIFGKYSSNSIIVLVYFLFAIVILSPSAFIGILIVVFTSQVALSFVVAGFCNLALSLTIMFLCRNLVHNIDFK